MKNYFFVFLYIVFQPLFSQNSIFDKTFGLNGYASTTRLKNRNFKKIVQSVDSSYFMVGEIQSSGPKMLTVAKFRKDGQLDLKFGSLGVYNYLFSQNVNVTVYDACSTYGNSILVSGITSSYNITNVILIKIKQEGILDSSFGSNGMAIMPYNYTNSLSFLKIDKHQKILLGCVRNTNSGNDDHLIVKFNSNGKIDSSFQKQGELKLVSNQSVKIKNVEVTNDNHYLICYFLYKSSNPIFTKFDSTGRLDVSFGSRGKMYIDVSPNNACSNGGIILTKNNGFYLFAEIANWVSLSSIILIYRYNEYGVLDSSFGHNGVVSNYLNSNINFGIDYFKNDNNFKIVVGIRIFDSCYSFDSFSNYGYCDYNSVIFRFKENGYPDSSFNYNGRFMDFKDREFDDEVSDIFIQNDNKIVVVGKVIEKGTTLRSFVCRLKEAYPNYELSSKVLEDENPRFYPNPFTNQIYIDGIKNITSFKLTDLTGKFILEGNIAQPCISNLDFLSNGSYLLEIILQNQRSYFFKVLKN